jgi:competence protein ComEA
MNTKTWQPWVQVLFGILIGLVLAAGIYLIAAQPKGESITLKPLPTARPIVVHIDGSVQNPGIYSLSSGSRITDAIQAAGGLSETANSGSINLAAILKDGEKVTIPNKTEANSPKPNKSGASDTSKPTPAGLVNINTASQADLMTLPGIGTEKADAIIQYRQEHGPFKSIDSIQDVTGIGPGIFDKLKKQIIIGPSD